MQQRHTHSEWFKFLRKIDRETPKGKTLHLIADNYATHKHPAVQDCWPSSRDSTCTSRRPPLMAEHGREILPRHHD